MINYEAASRTDPSGREGHAPQPRGRFLRCACPCNPILAGNANPDDLILWMAYKEARALIKFEPDPAAPRGPAGNDRASVIRSASGVTSSSACPGEKTPGPGNAHKSCEMAMGRRLDSVNTATKDVTSPKRIGVSLGSNRSAAA